MAGWPLGLILSGGEGSIFLLMDMAYEDWDPRRLAFERGYAVVAPPKKSRKAPREHDKELYKNRGMTWSGCSGG
jgi:hypothetical protein